MYELLTYHPTVHEKMKSGVAAIGWGINPAFPDTRSFFCRLESGEIMSPRRAQSAFETQSCIAQSAFETQSCTAQSAFETQSCTAQSAFETQSCTAQSAFETQSCTAQSAFETQPP
jgi:hypothetical protein